MLNSLLYLCSDEKTKGNPPGLPSFIITLKKLYGKDRRTLSKAKTPVGKGANYFGDLQ
jgi:hypothetical protein